MQRSCLSSAGPTGDRLEWPVEWPGMAARSPRRPTQANPYRAIRRSQSCKPCGQTVGQRTSRVCALPPTHSTKSRCASNSISLWELNPGSAERGPRAARGSFRSRRGALARLNQGAHMCRCNFHLHVVAHGDNKRRGEGNQDDCGSDGMSRSPGCRANHADKKPNWADSRRENVAAIENYV